MWKLNIFLVKLLDLWGLMITRNIEASFPMGLCLLFQLIGRCCDGLCQSSACKKTFICTTQDSSESTCRKDLDWKRNYSINWSTIHNRDIGKGVFLCWVLILCCLFLRGTLARALYSLRSTVKFVSPVWVSDYFHLINSISGYGDLSEVFWFSYRSNF